MTDFFVESGRSSGVLLCADGREQWRAVFTVDRI